jgi:hypothetical protein
MITEKLQLFCNRILDVGHICAEDVAALQHEVLVDGIRTREDVDVLVALDRAVPSANLKWSEFLVPAVVEFVVWTCRPTGSVDRDSARWLATSLGCGTGPTENAARIAFEVVRESQQVDEVLLAFTLSALRRPWLRSQAPRGAVMS